MKKLGIMLFVVMIMLFCAGCGRKKVIGIDNSMPSSYKDFEDLGFTIYDARGENMGIEIIPGHLTKFSSIITNEDANSVIAFNEDYTYMFCKNSENNDWSMISAYNPGYRNNDYKTFQDGNQIPAIALKNAYIIAQIMYACPDNSMKYVLPERLTEVISDDEVEISINLVDQTESGEFPRDISEGMWMITFHGKKTGNSLTICPGNANSKVNEYTLDYMFNNSTIEHNPEVRELYSSVYSEMEREGSTFDSKSMKVSMGESTIDAIIDILPYLNR